VYLLQPHVQLQKYVGSVPTYYAAVHLELPKQVDPDLSWKLAHWLFSPHGNGNFWFLYACSFTSQELVQDRRTEGQTDGQTDGQDPHCSLLGWPDNQPKTFHYFFTYLPTYLLTYLHWLSLYRAIIVINLSEENLEKQKKNRANYLVLYIVFHKIRWVIIKYNQLTDLSIT